MFHSTQLFVFAWPFKNEFIHFFQLFVFSLISLSLCLSLSRSLSLSVDQREGLVGCLLPEQNWGCLAWTAVPQRFPVRMGTGLSFLLGQPGYCFPTNISWGEDSRNWLFDSHPPGPCHTFFKREGEMGNHSLPQ